MTTWLLAAALAIIVTAIAYRLHALAPSGAIAAIILGTVVVGTGGWWLGIILVAYFATSSLWGRIVRAPGLDQARGNRRDWIQVLANGGGAGIGGILFALTGWHPWLLAALGAISAATADTWSSELGRLSRTPPRLITTFKPVPAGTSGAVSAIGTLASFSGALLIGALSAIASATMVPTTGWITVLVGITLAGIAGGLLDSVMGATLQEQRWCERCQAITERNPHTCGTTTVHHGGIRGLNNDVVNAACIFIGALFGVLSGIL